MNWRRWGIGLNACLGFALCSGVWLGTPSGARAQPATVRPERARQPELLLRLARRQALPTGAVKLKLNRAAAVAAGPAMSRVPLKPNRAAAVAAAPAMLRVPLELEGRDGDVAQAMRLTAGAGRITRAASGAAVLELPPSSQAIVSSAGAREIAAKSELSTDSKTPLPWLVVETRATAHGAELHTARPFLALAKAILWDRASERHVAEFLFGLDVEQGELGPLERPLDARFLVSCDDVSPPQSRVAAVGPSGYGIVRVGCSPKVKNERPQQFLEVHLGSGNLRYPFAIPRRPGAPVLFASAARVLGFGFGTAQLTVRRVEEDGTTSPAQNDMDVELVTRGGGLDVRSLAIRRGDHSGSVVVHPRGIRDVDVVAEVEGMRSEASRLQLSWPVLPLVVMTGGGLFGGFVSTLGPARRKRKHQLRRRLLEGALVGLLISAVVLVLPSFASMPGWARDTELGLFVLAALAGFIGSPLLDRAAGALFPVPSEAKSPATQ